MGLTAAKEQEVGDDVRFFYKMNYFQDSPHLDSTGSLTEEMQLQNCSQQVNFYRAPHCVKMIFLLIRKHFLLFHFQVEEEAQVAEEELLIEESEEEDTKVRNTTLTLI